MGDYLSPRKQQVYLRLRERLDKCRKSNEQSQRIFEASNPQRREQERQDTQDFHRRIIENRNKRAPRSVKAQESGQSKVKSESNGNCTNNEMGRNQPQVVKKAVDRKRPNPDSPNLTGTTEAINRTSALSLEASSSSSGMRGDASPAKKPCVDSKQLASGQVPTPNQYVQQQDPNRMGANNHAAQLTDNGVSNQAAHGASGGDGIEGVQGLDLLNDIGNSESVLRLLDDPSGTHLDEMMKSGQFNPETLLSELSRLESNLSMQLGEMPDIATNSPGSQDASKQSDTKPDTASNNTETGVVPKSENSDTYDPMMEGPPNTVATDALQKSGPLPSIHEFKPSSGKGVLVKQEPQQISASRATFNGQNVQTVTSSGAKNIVPQVNQLTPMQATGTSASAMNPSMRGSFVNQQSGMSGQQVNFLSTQQQQQLSSRQLLLNARMPSQQSHHSRMPNSMLSNTMNASMSSADQLSQFANNSMRGQSPQPGRLPSMQSLFQDCNPSMALSSGQGGNMMPGQASQFVQHSQQQQRMASTEILQRLQKPPHYNASAEQRKFVTNSYVQSPQQGHNMQPGNSQMLIPRRPPPRYDETPHRNSMAFQGPVNQGMPQQLGQQAGMMTHMVGQQNIRSMVPAQGVQGHLSNGMSAGAGNRGMMQGMAQQQSQQGMMQRLAPQIRRQILQQRAMQQQSSAMGNQMNMASIPPGAVNIGQAGVAQYQQRHMPAQWSGNQLLQHRMQQQNNNFQGNNVMQQQPYPTQQRFPQRNVMDSNMRTFQNITSQGGMSNVTNTNPSIMAQQQFVGQPAQSQQQQTQQPTQQQQQQPQPQQQQGSMQQPVQGNSITAMQNGSAVSGTNQSFGNNAQQMPMGMMLDSNNQQQQQQQQQQSGSSDMLELLDNIIKNDGPGRTNSHM